MNAPDRRPEQDPTRPFGPGGIDRDIADPTRPYDPRLQTEINPGPRGLMAATIAVVVVLLAIVVFSMIGGGDTQTADTTGNPPVAERVDDTTTSAVGTEADQPREEIPPIEPKNDAPVETAPAE
ncbi:hypothetical protein GN330_04370 [Nitratireductor sp. CAU 1489]|uniref:Uncharacterized protein n=1 Tax=Nitratireductor arenosus TaxID=2682096 RepID=A0A844QES2_9HYPH|nr:hypothetical protein [Nitratireductor arenosus]MVA96481.1 hypothetical protein [Nitratireductor arenosus]